MAIGDAVVVMMGTAAENRQPPSGVEEQLTGVMKPDTTDPIQTYTGSVTVDILAAAVKTQEDAANANQRNYVNDFNMSINYNNTVYLRKSGTTDTILINGVQTNV